MFPRLALLLLAVVMPTFASATAPATRPNILIAVADDWSYPHASAYGTTWTKTPHFDRVAREGLLFTRAYTPVAKCSASRATLLLGRHPWMNGAGFVHYGYFPAQYATYAEALRTHGYFTGFTGKGWSPGIALTADGKPRDLLGRAFQARKTTPPTTGISTVDYAANFADFLAAAPKGEPWCFWYGGNEPHRDYEFKSGVTKGGKQLADLPRVPEYWPDNETVRHDLLDYAMEVEYFDTQLGRILAELEKRGELANTIIIVTSDNGLPFPRSKGQCYEIANHLPLAIRWPAGIPHAGRKIDDYVSFPDLAPTLLEVAGLAPEDSGMAPASGRSLTPLFAGDQSGQIDPTRNYVLVGRERHDPGRPHNQGYPVRGIIADQTLYLRNFAPERWPAGNPETAYLDTDSSPTKSAVLSARRAGQTASWALSFGRRPAEELYDLSVDPDCANNLAGMLSAAPRQLSLERSLLGLLTAQGDPRVTGPDPDFFDRFPFARADLNDFYEQYQSGRAKLPSWADPTDVDLNLKE